MRPRVRGNPHAPAARLRGGVDNTPTEPLFRWTFRTWVEKTYWEYANNYPGKRQSARKLSENVMSVIAPTEAEAKRKVEAALGPLPSDHQGAWGPTEHIRHWEIQGTVEEVAS